MKERLLDVFKWGLSIVIAGAVYYGVSSRYSIVAAGEDTAYKLDRRTGEMWWVKTALAIPVEVEPQKQKATYR